MTNRDLEVGSLFDLRETMAAELLERVTYPWEALAQLGAFIQKLGAQLSQEEYEQRGEQVWVARDASVAPTACINGPAIIGSKAEVRHCAFIRGNVLIGAGAVVGNSTELKNAILFNRVQTPHYNYVGDSILGCGAHLGAGSITSNVKSDKTPVVIHGADGEFATGLRKLGAILGDYVEIGCGSVLNPGTVIGKNTNVYPLSMVRGCIPAGSIYKRAGEIAEKRRAE